MATTTVYGGSAQIAANDTDIGTNVTAISNLHGGVDTDAIDSVGTLATKTGLTVVEKGNAAVHKTIMTLTAVSVASTDGTTPGTDGAWATQLLYTFPEGHVTIHAAHMVCPLAGLECVTGSGTGFSDTADIGLGVGTVAAVQATEWGLSGTAENVITELDVDLTAKTSDAVESVAVSTPATYDGSAAATTLNLNYRCLGDDDHGVTADALLVTGTLTVIWSVLGND